MLSYHGLLLFNSPIFKIIVQCPILHTGNNGHVEIKRTFTFSMGLILQLSLFEKILCRRYLAWHFTHIILFNPQNKSYEDAIMTPFCLWGWGKFPKLRFTPRNVGLQILCSFHWDVWHWIFQGEVTYGSVLITYDEKYSVS